MNLISLLTRRSLGFCLLLALAGFLSQTPNASAKQGATDPIPGTSNGGVKSGGGGGGGKKGGSTTPAPAPAPAPNPQPLVVAPLTFTASVSVNYVVPVCTGSYRIDPYYPTLSLFTVDVQTSSVNVADGSLLYITVEGLGGTLYPFTSNAILIAGGSGSCSFSEYITPGTTIQTVTISDSLGNVIFVGK